MACRLLWRAVLADEREPGDIVRPPERTSTSLLLVALLRAVWDLRAGALDSAPIVLVVRSVVSLVLLRESLPALGVLVIGFLSALMVRVIRSRPALDVGEVSPALLSGFLPTVPGFLFALAVGFLSVLVVGFLSALVVGLVVLVLVATGFRGLVTIVRDFLTTLVVVLLAVVLLRPAGFLLVSGFLVPGLLDVLLVPLLLEATVLSLPVLRVDVLLPLEDLLAVGRLLDLTSFALITYRSTFVVRRCEPRDELLLVLDEVDLLGELLRRLALADERPRLGLLELDDLRDDLEEGRLELDLELDLLLLRLDRLEEGLELDLLLLRLDRLLERVEPLELDCLLF
jgi:hypothetical protein